MLTDPQFWIFLAWSAFVFGMGWYCGQVALNRSLAHQKINGFLDRTPPGMASGAGTISGPLPFHPPRAFGQMPKGINPEQVQAHVARFMAGRWYVCSELIESGSTMRELCASRQEAASKMEKIKHDAKGPALRVWIEPELTDVTKGGRV